MIVHKKISNMYIKSDPMVSASDLCVRKNNFRM